ncbi:MAG: tRNA (guanosine(18)-2'-O)-methyltransferase TrmH [Deinococcales bacterium]
MTTERQNRVRAVLDKRQPDLTVLLEHVHKPHNLSAILRSCDAVGVLEAHIVALEGRVPTFNETSAGSDKWLPLHQHPNTQNAFSSLRSKGFNVIAAHLSDTALDYREWDYTQPTAVLLGAEKWGVSSEAANLADAHIIIPMQGMVQSLNVSVAAAVVLFEAQRQRLEAGLYNAPRLTQDQYAKLEYEWLHPKEAEVLRNRGVPYPNLSLK